MVLAYVVVFTLIGSVLSLFGSFFLLAKKEIRDNFAKNLISFAAGAMITVAFFDLLPEAVEEAGENDAFFYVLLGFVIFFFAEKFIRLFHFHHGHGEKPTTYLVLIGDGVHNFIDGIIIAVAFLTSIPLGITTSMAVAAHEIPQEIEDMGILLANGLTKKKALLYNFLSALTALVGALLALTFHDFVEKYLYIFLAVAAGHFIYIAAADLIPELHESSKEDKKSHQIFFFVFGIFSIYVFTRLFEA